MNMTADDVERIKEAINAYFDGVKRKELEKFLESWHPEARMSFIREGDISSVPRSFWDDWCQQPLNKDEAVTCEIKSIDVTGTVAIAKTQTTKDNPESIIKYTDYLTLMKVNDDKWKIIQKSYHGETTVKE